MSKLSPAIKPEKQDDSANVARVPKNRSLWLDPKIASLMLTIAISFVGAGMVAPLRTLYAQEEGAKGGEVGLMAAAYLFSTFVFLFPFGWLSDRMNRVTLITIGLLAHGLITFAFIFAHDGATFIALRFVEGIATAAVMPASRAILADLVPDGRNGEAFGMMNGVAVFGMFAGPPIGSFLASSFGYSAAYILAAVIYLPAALLVLFTLRDYHPQIIKKEAKNDLQQNHAVSGKLLTTPILIGCIVKLALALGIGLGASVWSIYMAYLGFDLNQIGFTYTIYAIPAVLVAPYAGRFSDRYGRVGMMTIAGIAVGLIWGSYGIITAFIFFVIIGIVEGSLDAIARSANDGYLADYSPPESRGKAQGLFNAVQQFGSLIAAVLAGFLYEVSRNLPFFVIGGLQITLILVAISLYFILKAGKTLSVNN
jgi:MFS family permease